MYEPVCATNGDTNKVFGNECSMRAANCYASKGNGIVQLIRFGVFPKIKNWNILSAFSEYAVTNDADCPDYADYMK